MEQKEQRKSIHLSKMGLVIMALILLLLSVGMVGFNHYTQESLYQEASNQLTEITNQLFEKLMVQLDTQWDYLKYATYTQRNSAITTKGQLADFLADCEQRLSFSDTTLHFYAVDAKGYYYTRNGQQGIWDGAEKLLNDAEQNCFLLTDWLTNENEMVFSYRLEAPLTIGDATITHLALLRKMDDIAPYFRSSAFHNQNTTYVIDENGSKMFADTVQPNLAFQGRNIYHSLQNQTYPHLGSFDACLAEKEKNGTALCDVVINQEQYYMVLSQLSGYDWSMLIFVPQDAVAASTQGMVHSMLRIFIVALAVLMVSCIVVALFVVRFQKNQVQLLLKTQSEKNLTHANELLQGMNDDLQEVNHELEDAQQKAANALAVAETASKAKTDFLANMSHDIRTPMNAIVGITKLMAHDKNDPEKIGSYIEKVQQSSQHLLSLINDVLDMSKIESGEVTLNMEPISLADQVGQVESIIRPQVEERRQQLTLRTHNITHEHLTGDAVRLRQVFINLLSNAIKYTPNGGSIRLDLEELPCKIPDHAMLRIAVTDSGYGMTQEFMQHIFEPFTRAENSTTNRVQGTGLGMAITKNIVDLSGGTISVQSELNKGSCFTVELPFQIDHTVQTELPIHSALLVTDDQTLMDNVRAALKETAIPLLVATSEAEVDKALQSSKPDVILLGSRLKNQKLMDNLQRLKEKTGDALLFYCCDYEEREQVGATLENGGVDGVLRRPFFLSDLAHAIEHTHNATAQEDAPESMSVLNGMRFLCAEDNALNAEILQAVLDMNDATCVIYPDGQKIVEAFAAVKPGDFDAILMDVQMPVMNGLDATRAIRRSANPLGKTIPIIAMTANAFSEDVQNCLNAGMDAHVSKPLDIAALERTIKSVVSIKFSGGGTILRIQR